MRKEMKRTFAMVLAMLVGVSSALPAMGAEPADSTAINAEGYDIAVDYSTTEGSGIGGTEYTASDESQIAEQQTENCAEPQTEDEDEEQTEALITDRQDDSLKAEAQPETPDETVNAELTEDTATEKAEETGTCEATLGEVEAESTDQTDIEAAESDLIGENTVEESVGLSQKVATTREELVNAMRIGLRCREESFEVAYDLPEGTYTLSYFRNALEEAKKDHTGFCLDGDYIYYNLASRSWIQYMTSNKGKLLVSQKYKLSENDNLRINMAVIKAFNYGNIIQDTDYETVLALHDYICRELTYNTNYISDGEYNIDDNVSNALTRSMPAYNAYAVLFYHMALRAGIDCRVINGSVNGVEHLWNIVKIGNKYYNIDTAMDDWLGNKEYFLKTDAAFIDHTRSEEYRKASFRNSYPMATSDYPYKEIVSFEDASVRTKSTSYVYTGNPRKPAPVVKIGGKTLTYGEDYTVSYRNNRNVGTATLIVTGIGSYTGTAKTTFKLTKASLNGATAKTKLKSYTYSGYARCPKPIVKLGNKTLQIGTDYTVSYKNNTNVGTATVIITGKGNCSGTITTSFKLTRRSIANASVKTRSASYVCTGKARCPKPIVMLGNRTLKLGSDYTLSYRNNVKAGTATVIVTGKGNYSGTAKTTFTLK